MTKTKQSNAGRPRSIQSVEELNKRINNYKKYLEDTGNPPTIAGLAYYTKLDRQTIYNYMKRDEYFDTIKEFRDWILMTYEERAMTNSQASGVIFLLKNYGYSDKQEIEHINPIEMHNYDMSNLSIEELKHLKELTSKVESKESDEDTNE